MIKNEFLSHFSGANRNSKPTPSPRQNEDNELEGDDCPPQPEIGLAPPPPKPTPCELRVAQYEKPLTKGHLTRRIPQVRLYK